MYENMLSFFFDRYEILNRKEGQKLLKLETEVTGKSVVQLMKETWEFNYKK